MTIQDGFNQLDAVKNIDEAQDEIDDLLSL